MGVPWNTFFRIIFEEKPKGPFLDVVEYIGTKPVDDPQSEILLLYQKTFPMDYVPRDRRRDLNELEEEHGKENLIKAMEVAKEQGKASTRYIRGILRDQKATGYKWGEKDNRKGGVFSLIDF